jgi:hypothetical protein
MAHASEPDSAPIRANAILDFEMAALHSDFDSVAGQRENAGSAEWGFAGKDRLR